MTDSAKEYRNKLVDMVYATGIYMIRNADKIVDLADLKVDFSINISYEYNEPPKIEIIQSHAMRELMEVQCGK